MKVARECYADLSQRLHGKLQVTDEEAFWLGELSSSALSTALACIVFSLDKTVIDQQDRLQRGFAYLIATQLQNGSWGDTANSPGNTSTALLVYAAFKLQNSLSNEQQEALEQLEKWLVNEIGGLDATILVKHIGKKYGKDQTFAVPILMALAIARCVPWQVLPQLPFELAVFPQSLYAALRLPVVSYALPALIAIGIARHAHVPAKLNPMYALRSTLRKRCLRILAAIQPSNGGFLEATPLTAFVAMALHQAIGAQSEVYQKARQFLISSQRGDGSWPIDTNLSTWVTSLAVHACERPLPQEQKLESFYLRHQFKTVHPYTGAAPGAWAWTILPGAVPDADDTSGALLALCKCNKPPPAAIEAGVRWLIALQNTNGGMPTFCRGWGTLPFDQSCVDISAHALRALRQAHPYCTHSTQELIQRRRQRLLNYIVRQQRADGAFLPLWFGNQAAPRQENPVLGTARVLLALAQETAIDERIVNKSVEFLLHAQHADGAWGPAAEVQGSVEETALVIEALSALSRLNEQQRFALDRGVAYLCDAWSQTVEPQPIGLYFASLWYHEELYPLTFSVAALRVYLEHDDESTH